MPRLSFVPHEPLRTRLLVAVICLSLGGLIGIVVWRTLPQKRPETPVYKTGPFVNAIACSIDRDSKYLAAATSDGRVLLWDTTRKQLLPVKLPSQLPLNDLTWNVDGTLYTGGFEQHVLAWNVKEAKARKLPIFPAQIVSLACRPGRGELLISLSGGQLILADAESNEQTVLETGHQGVVKVVRFHPQGAQFVTGGVDGQLIWHEWGTRLVSRVIPAHQHEISSLCFSPDGKKLVTGSWDQTVKVWTDESTKPRQTFKHASEVAQVGWLGDDVVTTSWDEELRIWNVDSGLEISSTNWKHSSLAFGIRQSTQEIIGVSPDGTWHLWKK